MFCVYYFNDFCVEFLIYIFLMLFIYFCVLKMFYNNVILFCVIIYVLIEIFLVEWRKRFNIKGDVFGCLDFVECMFLFLFWSCFKVDCYFIWVFFNIVC